MRKASRFVAVMACIAALPVHAATQDCTKVPVMLWGEGRHDDTVALNAWLRGHEAIWADAGTPVGAAIGGRRFRLSSAIYVQAGTGRVLRDFRLEWPERGEVVTGGMIAAGADPHAGPLPSRGTNIRGGPGGSGPLHAPPRPAGHTPPH